MIRAEESGFVRSDFPLSPMLFGYDAQGQLLWLSDRASCGLATMETALLRQYFRLQAAERGLNAGTAVRTAGKVISRRDAALATQRQMELERQRLGRELHTGVGQMLAAMRLQLEVIAEQLPQPPEMVSKALDRLSVLAREAIDQVRSLSRKLHPPEWQRLELEEAVRQLWELSGIPQAFQATLRVETLPEQPDLPIKVFVYRAAQEALSNLVRHSRATQVSASLEGRNGGLVFEIEDNGVGFDVAALENAPATIASGIGLRATRELAKSLGASFVVQSGPGHTKLTITAPMKTEDD